MWDYIVLGQIPGTGFQLGFIGYLIFFDLALTYYLFKKYHPEKLTEFNQKLHLLENLKKLYKKLNLYEKKLAKKLVHYRDDVLSPKLKFLK